ncbi:DinB family protein [Bacillus sp. JCM 19041]|uniref:DinB family protein n=1 Tax=Bacillus sp. JCM 19041 TaxID=1460637 RepID=UPI0006D0B7C1
MYMYRNDCRKILLPYLENLSEEEWFKQTVDYPKNIAWIIVHIAGSEDYWINEVWLKKPCIIDLHEKRRPEELIKAYTDIRTYSDQLLINQSPHELDKLIEVPEFGDGWKPPSPPTVNWLFNHLYSHETYHVGQLAIIARLNGITPPQF